MIFLTWFWALLFIPVAVQILYLYLPALASIPSRRTRPSANPCHRFAILIPAHNEETVIGATVVRLLQMDYPKEMYDIYVVADHCADATAHKARLAGALCYERTEGIRGNKAAALTWLLKRVEESGRFYDAYVIFDADTLVDPAFLRYMDTALSQGYPVIQGRHIIRNPRDGAYPALAYVMFLLDNRFQNQGRSNLGWSAKLMGDSVCFRADLLERFAWAGDSLTEDYELRFRLLMEGIRIHYLPEAVGCGEAPLTWADARRQRARWLAGTRQARRRYARPLLQAAFRRRDLALLDGALQNLFLPYSPLTLLTGLLWVIALTTALLGVRSHIEAWSIALGLLFLYPIFGLLLEHAPIWAFRSLIFAPFFILWRTGLDLLIRLGWKKAVWIRTPRRAEGRR